MSKALAIKNVAAVLLGVAMVLGFTFAVATPAKADVVSDLQAQVQALLAQITSLQGSTAAPSAMCHTFTRNHVMGNKGGEVAWIQEYLKVSPQSGYFGSITKAAVAKFQADNGITPAAGYWGPLTRAKANALCSTTGGTTGGTTTPTPTGTGVTVSASAQPTNSLAVKGAVRVPFTNFTLTNNSGAAVTVNGVTVERTGLGQDAAFAGVVLVDSSNVQLGTSKTLNSNHQAIVGDTFTLMPGESKMLTVAGNMNTSLSAYTGQVVGLSVVGVNTTATVAGSLPINGAQQTLNDSLSIGTVTIGSSSFDPQAAQTKNIGDTGIKFSAIRFTAGSAEDVKLYSVRFRQVGSVSSSDLANVVVVVDGVTYPAVVSTDGKYYTSVFPGGLMIAKGFSKDVHIQGDVIGGNASGRYAQFDIDKTSDVYFVGQLYGYGVTPTGSFGSISTAGTHGSGAQNSGQPWFQGSTFTITGASVTTMSKATEVPAQNVAVNVPNQPLGGFVFDLKGENITVQSHTFTIATSSTGAGLLTSVSLVDENGAVIAGPVDATGAGNTVTFTDSVTYKTGRHVYTLKGKLPSTFTNNGTITLSTTPSSQWTNVTGATTGNTVSLSALNSAVTFNTMTVRSAQLAVAISSTPSAQTIVSGGQGITFANVQFDASQSGEDIRFSSFPIEFGTTTNVSALNVLSSCQAFDGASALNTGSNVVNPVFPATGAGIVDSSFVLDNSLVVTKGTVKTITIKCNVASGATGALKAGMTGSQITAMSATGVTSSNGVAPTGSTNLGQVMTLASGGSLAVSNSPSTPSYLVTAGGSSDVVSGVYKLRATNEDFNMTEIALTLNGGGAASDLVSVSLWKGTTALGTVTFTGSATVASTTIPNVLITKDVDTDITAKVTYGAIGSNQPATAGATVAIDLTAVKGTGASSGNTIYSTGVSSVAGVRLQKSYPTVAIDTLASTGVADGNLMKFKVTANSAGAVGVAKINFTLATSSANVSAVSLYGYTDAAYSNAIAGFSGGVLNASPVAPASAGAVSIVVANATGVQVPAGTTYYFLLKGTVAGTAANYSVSTTLLGDSAAAALAASSSVATNFVWSPNSTTTTVGTVTDWTNGYGLTGLPAVGISSSRNN